MLLRRRIRVVIAVMAAQAAIGYVQYFNELPVVLVALHVVGATLLTIAMTRLVLTVETGRSVPDGTSDHRIGWHRGSWLRRMRP